MSNITTKTSKNTKINSLPLRNSYEVMRINENDYVENWNEDITKRAIILNCRNKKMHTGLNSQFVEKVSSEWFFHSAEIN